MLTLLMKSGTEEVLSTHLLNVLPRVGETLVVEGEVGHTTWTVHNVVHAIAQAPNDHQSVRVYVR